MLINKQQQQDPQKQTLYSECERVSFKDFIVSLSTISRGTVEERVKWLFNFYDTNKDNKISRDVSYLSIGSGSILTSVNGFYSIRRK